jgi:hypothetical protein
MKAILVLRNNIVHHKSGLIDELTIAFFQERGDLIRSIVLHNGFDVFDIVALQIDEFEEHRIRDIGIHIGNSIFQRIHRGFDFAELERLITNSCQDLSMDGMVDCITHIK